MKAKPRRKPVVAEPVVVFRPRYSGDLSIPFWKAVNATNDHTLYLYCCALQDIEARLLQVLNEKAGK